MNQTKIAEKTGVSQSSVSLVLKNPATTRVSEKTKARIIRCLKESSYVNPSGGKRTWNIGCITDPLQDLHQDFFQESLRGIEEETAKNHYNLMMECLRSNDLSLLKNNKVDGLIIRSGKAYEFLQECGTPLPVVLLNCASSITRCDSVMPDNRSGIHKAVRYLAERGKTRIAFLGSSSSYSPYSCNYRERHFSFIEACSVFNMEYLLECVGSGPGVETQIEGVTGRWKTMKNPPQAVICVNYRFSCIVQQLWQEIEVIAGDSKTDGITAAQDFPVLIQDSAYMGKLATELLLKRIAEPGRQHVRINCDMDLYIPETKPKTRRKK